ncbi:uncharacterized protein BDZ99DRAFT_524784 [Mytilinidion resinicola]|uniref:Uncharacterized protein n=1 Tax=Mytilinidion resinicola TaxID=574789 RepID=A0A6A6Y8N9_9PEZI|nr:uncharacterized protein BDZ99DRAFT_524784 [Mytilinidion resinicola]KAF2805060.1 hypothetical protein BDZ99DRAFT_524784 [Mytilinidion resinicola]
MPDWHHAMERRVSDCSTDPLRQSPVGGYPVGGYFWSQRGDRRSDDGSGTDAGKPLGISKTPRNRASKAKHEKEMRSFHACKIKKLEDFLLHSTMSDQLKETAKLNSNNSHKSGLTYRKDDVLKFAILLLQHQESALRNLMGKIKVESRKHWEHCELLKELDKFKEWAPQNLHISW